MPAAPGRRKDDALPSEEKKAAADLLALEQLSYRYASALDHRDPVKFGELFHPDSTLRVIASRPDGDEVISTYSGLAEIGPIPLMFSDKTFHFMGNHLFDVNGDQATGEVYGQAHHLLPVAGARADYMMLIRYADSYRRSADGQWLFASRDVVAHWNETHTGISF
jgi:hypothetical protein